MFRSLTEVNWLTQEHDGELAYSRARWCCTQATDMDGCSSTFLNKPIHVMLGKCIPLAYPLDTVSDRSFTSCQYSVLPRPSHTTRDLVLVTTLVVKPHLLRFLGGDKLL